MCPEGVVCLVRLAIEMLLLLVMICCVARHTAATRCHERRALCEDICSIAGPTMHPPPFERTWVSSELGGELGDRLGVGLG